MDRAQWKISSWAGSADHCHLVPAARGSGSVCSGGSGVCSPLLAPTPVAFITQPGHQRVPSPGSSSVPLPLKCWAQHKL